MYLSKLQEPLARTNPTSLCQETDENNQNADPLSIEFHRPPKSDSAYLNTPSSCMSKLVLANISRLRIVHAFRGESFVSF